jgi:thiamine-monophosphate kinase
MRVSDIGEFGLIKWLIEQVKAKRGGPDNTPPGGRLLVDVGDDTAAWETGQNTIELFTTDTMVDGVHFTTQTTPWKDLGWKAMAANISDIAAMGGLPLYALITLGLPLDVEVSDIDALYDGMLEINHEYGVSIIGGDIVRSPVTFVTISLTGVTERGLLLRSSAYPGDLVAVTGYVGGSAGGLDAMLNGVLGPENAIEQLKIAHRRPRPCIAEGRILSREGVKAAMDISDGLLDDIHKMCELSGVAARINRDVVPVHPALKEVFPGCYQGFALGGGEDYQLVFTATPTIMKRVIVLLPQPATIIGEVMAGTPGKVTLLDASGHEVPMPKGGWDHFA